MNIYLAHLYNPVIDDYTIYEIIVAPDLDEAECEGNYINVRYMRKFTDVVDEDEAYDKDYDINKYKIDYVYSEDITAFVFLYRPQYHEEFLTKEQIETIKKISLTL